MSLTLAESVAIRESVQQWFQGFGRYCHEETRQPVRGRANVLQRRMMEHYRQCLLANKPCRMAALKYRRAGSSTGSEAILYTHAHNFTARLGAIGTDYKASSNMLEMLKFFGAHDDFPGWGGTKMAVGPEKKVTWDEWDSSGAVPFAERMDKMIATKLAWSHGSSVELYTASAPESARSAGLSGYHATEVGRWPTGGQLDAAETLASMRGSLPKSGFHIAIEESTANGAQGAFYDTCRRARWPRAQWAKQFASSWPLDEAEYGRDLQFVFIFAAWFEDDRHIERDPDPAVNEARDKRVQESLDADPRYAGERELIALYGQDGPRGQRLGGEVDATVWEQLAWRRGIIANVCTRRGLDEFKQEYPSNPLEAFRSSGTAVFDVSGMVALDAMRRAAENRGAGEWGTIDVQKTTRAVAWRRGSENDALIQRWEEPIVGCRYICTVDTKENSEIIKGTGVLDNNSVLILRDAYQDHEHVWHPVKLVARIKAPNQWDDAPLAHAVAPLARYYGDCMIVVENNKGLAILIRLRDEHKCRIYCAEHMDAVTQRKLTIIGWRTDEGSRRQMVSTGQEYVREQSIEILCPHVIGEMRSFIYDTKGKATAASGTHDDDVMALLMGLCCLHVATLLPERSLVQKPCAVDEKRWTTAGRS